jgi:hypothetical protein
MFKLSEFEFKTEIQKNVFEALLQTISESVKAGVFPSESVMVFPGTILVQHNSAVVRLVVIPVGEEEAYVHMFVPLVTGAKLSGELLMILLKHAFDQLVFGSFGLDVENDAITLGHTLIGTSASPYELARVLDYLARKADELDDQIIEMAGGESSLQQLLKQMEQPA